MVTVVCKSRDIRQLLEGRADAVWRARIDLQRSTFDDLGREQGRGADRYDLVVVAMHDQCRHVEFLEIFREVRLGKGLDAIDHSFEPGLHPLEPERIPQALRDLGALPVGAVKRRGKVLEELRAVGEYAGTDLVKRRNRQAAGIGSCFHHEWRYSCLLYTSPS